MEERDINSFVQITTVRCVSAEIIADEYSAARFNLPADSRIKWKITYCCLRRGRCSARIVFHLRPTSAIPRGDLDTLPQARLFHSSDLFYHNDRVQLDRRSVGARLAVIQILGRIYLKRKSKKLLMRFESCGAHASVDPPSYLLPRTLRSVHNFQTNAGTSRGLVN